MTSQLNYDIIIVFINSVYMFEICWPIESMHGLTFQVACSIFDPQSSDQILFFEEETP